MTSAVYTGLKPTNYIDRFSQTAPVEQIDSPLMSVPAPTPAHPVNRNNVNMESEEANNLNGAAVQKYPNNR